MDPSLADEVTKEEKASVMEAFRLAGKEDAVLKVIDGNLGMILKAHHMNQELGKYLTDPRVVARLVSDKIREVSGIQKHQNQQRRPSGKTRR